MIVFYGFSIGTPLALPAQFHSGTGIPEELLVSQVQAVSPQQAKQLITLMVGQGALHQHTVTTVPCANVPSIFGLSEPAKDQVIFSIDKFQDFCIALCYYHLWLCQEWPAAS